MESACRTKRQPFYIMALFVEFSFRLLCNPLEKARKNAMLARLNYLTPVVEHFSCCHFISDINFLLAVKWHIHRSGILLLSNRPYCAPVRTRMDENNRWFIFNELVFHKLVQHLFRNVRFARHPTVWCVPLIWIGFVVQADGNDITTELISWRWSRRIFSDNILIVQRAPIFTKIHSDSASHCTVKWVQCGLNVNAKLIKNAQFVFSAIFRFSHGPVRFVPVQMLFNFKVTLKKCWRYRNLITLCFRTLWFVCISNAIRRWTLSKQAEIRLAWLNNC